MEQPPPVYDSITSGALRMARRRWYLVLLAGVLGLFAGFALTDSAGTWSAEADVRITFASVAPGPEDDPTRTVVDPAAIALRVEEAEGDLEIPDDAGVSVQGNMAAGSISLAATGATEAAATEALGALTDYTQQLVISELSGDTTTRIAALESLQAAEQARLDAADQRIAELQRQGASLGPSDPAILERDAAADALAGASSELELARSRLDTLSETAVTVSSVSTEEGGSSPVLPLAMAVLAVALVLVAMLVAQVFDGRLRRRIQIERSAPSTSVVGVLPIRPSDGDIRLVERSLGLFASERDLHRIVVVPLRGRVTDDLDRLLGQASEKPEVLTSDLAHLSEDVGRPGVGFLLCVPFGSVTEDRLQGVVAEMTTAGSEATAVLLTGVPRPDRDWASVSSR